MTQQGFDSQLVEMKREKHNTIRQVEAMQMEIKEEIADKKRQMSAIYKELHKLEQQRHVLGARRIQIETEWGTRISEFVSQRPNQSSNLADATTENIVAELRRRKYLGRIVHPETGKSYEIKYEIKPEDEEAV